MKRKKLSIIIAITFLCIVLIGFFACGEQEPCNIFTEVENRPSVIPWIFGFVYGREIISSEQQFYELIVSPSSSDFWTEFIGHYTNEFFENYVLVLVQININAGEFPISLGLSLSFYTVVTNSGYLHFIFRSSTFPTGHLDIGYFIFFVELPRELIENYAVNHSAYVINNVDSNVGSIYHPPFKGIIHYLDGRQVEFPLAAEV